MTAALLGEFVAGIDSSHVAPELVDTVRLHIFDTLGAAFAGATVSDTIELTRILGDAASAGPALALGPQVRTALPLAALLACAATRCTEVDDIHIASCITPGSVIVPTAFAVASCTAGIDDRRFLDACLAGYEVFVRFGLAVDGPRILYKGIWPTYLCAGFGVAATVGKLLDLSADQIAHALSIAATLAGGTVGGRAPGLTSRWFLLGASVQSALVATLAAARGMHGDLALIGERWAQITGIGLDVGVVGRELGRYFHTSELSFKPVCAAKQTIAAIYALQALIDEDGFAAQRIDKVLVEVPSAYAKMIDHAAPPATRLDSISSVQYQLALAACARDRQLDVTRRDVELPDDAAAIFSKVEVAADPALEVVYPRQWPARVTALERGGKKWQREVFSPFGDPATGFDWKAAWQKFERISGRGTAKAGSIALLCQRLGEPRTLRALLTELERASA
jgi:2-methylcitrate dehydratase PrpD